MGRTARREHVRRNSIKLIDDVIDHEETVVLTPEECPGAWDYVCNVFPSLDESIRSIKVYKNENTYFMNKIGIPKGVAGIFVPAANAIVVCWCSSIPVDVVLVHELLHYASRLIGSHMKNSAYEEDFALRKSIPYLTRNGYDREWIVENYLLPYFKSLRKDKKLKSGKNPIDKCNTLLDNVLEIRDESDISQSCGPSRFSRIVKPGTQGEPC